MLIYSMTSKRFVICTLDCSTAHTINIIEQINEQLNNKTLCLNFNAHIFPSQKECFENVQYGHIHALIISVITRCNRTTSKMQVIIFGIRLSNRKNTKKSLFLSSKIGTCTLAQLAHTQAHQQEETNTQNFSEHTYL